MQYVAIDLGAGSGRVILARLEERLQLEVLHRFANEPRQRDGHLRWDMAALFAGVETGLARLPDGGRRVRSIGADTWGVDYGLLDARNRLLEDPVCYRDARNAAAVERVFAEVSRAEVFAKTGVQVQQFNTLFQLFAHQRSGGLPAGARRLLLMPDLVHHWLCGSVSAERTIASTTQLLEAGTDRWADALFAALGLPRALMPPVIEPGTRLGVLREALSARLGLAAVAVVAPAAHDTASAVAGTPLSPGWAYISSGTWSLVGVETAAPVVSEAVAADNLTNEAGAWGTNRLLRNVMGMWILESCRRRWQRSGSAMDYAALLSAVDRAPRFRGFINPDDPRFFHPPDMADEVCAALRESGQPAPDADDQPAVARVVLESLAMRYASSVAALERATGAPVRGVHVIGGGAQNEFLNRATASACGLPVRAGPIEATATGNILVQAIADGCFDSLEDARAFVAASAPPSEFEPGDRQEWAAAAERYRDVAESA